MALALMDVDDTLIHGYTGFLSLPYLRRAGIIGWKHVFRAVHYVLLNNVGLLDDEKMLCEVCEPFVGQRVESVQIALEEALREVLLPRLRQDGLSCLERHRWRGDQLVLFTSTSRLVASPLARTLDIPNVVALFQRTKDGFFLPGLEEPICYGEGKLLRLQAFAAEREEDLEEAYYYTDSYRDLSALRAVGHPRPVNPDRHLKRVAHREGWLTLQWSNRRALLPRRGTP